jgi:dipeptidyl aminopeptidase/acylaminoacyl peptidase
MMRDLFSLKVIFTVIIGAVSLPVLAEPYPLEYFALRDVVDNVEVSPDGKYVAMLKILSKSGNPVLYVHETSDLDLKPIVVDSKIMEITSYGFVSDTDIVVVFREKTREKITGQNEGVYESKIALLDLATKSFDEFNVGYPSIENILPNEANRIIISTIPGTEDKLNLGTAFRPRTYYKLNLKTGAKELLLQGKLSMGQVEFDSDGDPWLARGFNRGSQEYVWYYREKGGKGWDEIFRLHEDRFENFVVFGKDEAVPGNVLVGFQNGTDTAGLWSFSTKTKSFEEQIYQRNDADIYGVKFHSNNWMKPDSISGVTYFKDRLRVEWFDEVERATYAQLEELIPNAHYLNISSKSRDGKTMTIYNSGPHDPGTYYLYRNGEFETVGSKQPLIDSEELADVKYISYRARDGRKIPAYVTVPNGKPPFPLVVLPHGGPFVQETIVYDEWAQMFANNGYLVLQPQFRGSQGYGLDHHLSAWKDGSESGFKMQDDKDDGAVFLVEKGYADPDRMAMFGWSYGGYAALVAASRTPQIYQCVIAGAAVTDMIKQVNTIANESWFRGSGEIEQLAYRKGALNPIDEVSKVNVPILMIHGSVDQRVQPVQARIYLKELEKHGKPYKFVELDGADHFSNTWTYDHQMDIYQSMIDFLANDCGPNGLADDLSAASNEQ